VDVAAILQVAAAFTEERVVCILPKVARMQTTPDLE